MKIIISHDVDHLYVSEHYLKDLIIPKLLVRSLLHVFTGKISIKTFSSRVLMIFNNRMNRLDEIMEFDKQEGIPSIFFFGMANGLGMSYSKKKVLPMIERVARNGFDIGVHGVEFENIIGIKQEHDAFAKISNMSEFGIRNHYVRFEDKTFNMLEKVGYTFDSTWFDKEKLNIKGPYKVGNMWEFPLHIMDGYICKPGLLKKGISDTIRAIRLAEEKEVPYCTILFHDYQFDDNTYPDMKKWYLETVKYIKENRYEFISYKDAVAELEESRKCRI